MNWRVISAVAYAAALAGFGLWAWGLAHGTSGGVWPVLAPALSVVGSLALGRHLAARRRRQTDARV